MSEFAALFVDGEGKTEYNSLIMVGGQNIQGNKTALQIATEIAGKSKNEDKIGDAIQGMGTLQLAALVDEINSKEKEKGEISNLEAGLREESKGKIGDLRARSLEKIS